MFLGYCLLACQLYAGGQKSNLLLNGNFEDINTCTEYNSECGVEAWFYLNNVKVQMISNEEPARYPGLGGNSFGIYFKWTGYKKFSPIIGTILPCRLQQGARYMFTGMFKRLNPNPELMVWPGIAAGEKFYVPGRAFSAAMQPDSITQISFIRDGEFYRFEYNFTATGNEKYLTFGTFISQDTASSKAKLFGTQTISLILDDFQLLPQGMNEQSCDYFTAHKEAIYNYNFRHKEMDYSLFGKGYLNIQIDSSRPNDVVIERLPLIKPVKTDTLKLGDVLFDFNKANLKAVTLHMLEDFFKQDPQNDIDSIYVEGHTDSIGTGARNMELSNERCQSVVSWLTKSNIVNNDHIQVHPYGKTRPIASNSTAQGRALNRRVEIIIFRKEKN